MFYPYVLYLVSEGVIRDEETGEVSSNPNPYRFLSECRDQPNNSGSTIQGADGVSIQHKSVIHLPLSIQDINEGDEVIVYQDKSMSIVRAKGTVLRFHRGLMHCRLWV